LRALDPKESRIMGRVVEPALLVLLWSLAARAGGPPAPTRVPLLRAIDLDVGETRALALSNGKTAQVKLLGVSEARDSVRDAVRRSQIQVEIDGQRVELTSGNYLLPTTVAGVQVDCPITLGYLTNTNQDHWGLVKAARLRLWPGDSLWVEPDRFRYPVRQRWFATSTQMANEPTYVDEFERPTSRRIYYHAGLDIGGAEGLVTVVAASAGVVVSAGKAVLAGYNDTPARPRYDVVYLLDDQGWYYRYSHLKTIDAAIIPGAQVSLGQKIGLLGKEGDSGGWSHLHFEIVCRQPSGKWGTQEGYAFLWQAWLRENQPALVAVARPHHLVWTGETVTLDGSRSYARSGALAGYHWSFHDGTSASGRAVERTYTQPGEYSEMLKVTDAKGNTSYDFAIVQVLDRSAPAAVPPTIHAAYAPTQGLRAGDEVTFKVRTFGTTDGTESWNFGDGSPRAETRSDGNVDAHAADGYASITHRFGSPGDYFVSVERSDRRGQKAVARLHVSVGK
jgi:murein DD-endopeptidase MepM/ murein hydrolase activator NlpD